MIRKPLIHLLLALALLALVVGAYAAWYAIVGKASAQAASLAGAIDTKARESTRILAAKEALETLAEDERNIDSYFIRTDDVVPFLGELESTGEALGAEVEVVSVSADTDTARPHITLALRIRGPFDPVLRTLGAIEYAPYDSRLQTLTLDFAGDPASDGSTWNAAAIFSIGTKAAAKP